MVTHAYEKDKERLFELVKENDIDSLDNFLKVLKQKEHSARKRIGKFAGFLVDAVYDLNKIYKDDKSLVMMACEYGNSKMIKLLVNHDTELV